MHAHAFFRFFISTSANSSSISFPSPLRLAFTASPSYTACTLVAIRSGFALTPNCASLHSSGRFSKPHRSSLRTKKRPNSELPRLVALGISDRAIFSYPGCISCMVHSRPSRDIDVPACSRLRWPRSCPPPCFLAYLGRAQGNVLGNTR